MPERSLEDPDFPDAFEARLREMADDPEALLETLRRPRPPVVRVNTLKADVEAVVERLEGYGFGLEPVPWAPGAFRLDDVDADPGKTLEHFLGHLYVQSAVSMLPPVAVEAEVRAGVAGSKGTENNGALFRVLDGCAAPGSKTTQLAAMMDNRGVLVANDLSYGRIAALKNNLDRCGVANTWITNRDLRHVSWPKELFDVVVVDAPCSAEGVLRKTWGALEGWSEHHIESLSGVQRDLAVRGFDLLRPGGVLVYATCTFGPEENEGVVDALLAARGDRAEVEPLAFEGLKAAPGMDEWRGRAFDQAVRGAVRVWPHHNDTDGFFLARVRKRADGDAA